MKPLTMLVAAGAVVLAGAAVHVQSVHAQTADVDVPMNTRSEVIPRLPNVFRDCWEPLPRHCVRPPGLLWFGDATTLRHTHRARRSVYR
jgi:hypothetical protein